MIFSILGNMLQSTVSVVFTDCQLGHSKFCVQNSIKYCLVIFILVRVVSFGGVIHVVSCSISVDIVLLLSSDVCGRRDHRSHHRHGRTQEDEGRLVNIGSPASQVEPYLIMLCEAIVFEVARPLKQHCFTRGSYTCRVLR